MISWLNAGHNLSRFGRDKTSQIRKSRRYKHSGVVGRSGHDQCLLVVSAVDSGEDYHTVRVLRLCPEDVDKVADVFAYEVDEIRVKAWHAMEAVIAAWADGEPIATLRELSTKW